MYDSNRHGYITFGWVATIIFALLAGAVYHSQYTRIEQSTEYANKCAKQNQSDAAPSANVASPAGDQETSDGDDSNKRQPDWCDLAAQQSMAESTRGMHWAAWATVAFTGFGAFLIWRTLLATQDTVIETRRIGERQVRAYVHLVRVELEHADDEYAPAVNVIYKNFGQSPARHVINNLNLSFNLLGPPSFKEKVPKEIERGTDLGPGQETTTTTHISFNSITGLREGLAKRAVTLFVFGRITYLDAFGEHRETRYRLQLHVNPEGVKDTDSFLLCKEGNEST